MKKRFLSFLLASLLVVSAAVPVQAADIFRDVPKGYWAYNAITEMADKGIVSGKGDGRFDPNGKVTNAEFVSMLMRMEYGQELAKDGRTYSQWYEKAMKQAKEKGILFQLDLDRNWGYNGGAESMKENAAYKLISREEMAVMLYNHLKQKVQLPAEETLRTVTVAKIPDLHNSNVFEQFAIASVYELGCLSGMDASGTFEGKQYMTRAQACTVLKRVQTLKQTSFVGADWVNAVESGRLTKVLKAATLANGKEATEQNVADRLNELRSRYPHGMSCSNENFYYIDPKTGENTGNRGCYALMMYMYDYVFGYGSSYRAEKMLLTADNFDKIKVGDHIRIESLPHSIVVLETAEDYVKVVEGNRNKKVYWDSTFTKKELLSYEDVWVYSCY